MELSRAEEINNFISEHKHLGREAVNKLLKQKFNVQFMYNRYRPHAGLKERVRRMTKKGLTMEQIEHILFGNSEDDKNE